MGVGDMDTAMVEVGDMDTAMAAMGEMGVIATIVWKILKRR